MENRKWVGFTDTTEEDKKPTIELKQTTRSLVTEGMRDAGQRTSLTVHYQVEGAWLSSVQMFQALEIPGTSHVDDEGCPAVPKDGLFIALPDDARDVEVHVIEKSAQPVTDEIHLAPQAKHFKEEEFQEVFEPEPEIYDADVPYPDRDFDFIGLKTMEGVKVAHLILYLGQYRPKSKLMELVQSMVLEISYTTPPQMDRSGGRKPRRVLAGDLILGIDLLDEEGDFSASVRDFSGQEVVEVDDMENRYSPPGLSGLETEGDQNNFVEVDSVDSHKYMPDISDQDRPKLKISGLICEYLIITSRALAASVEPLRSSKAGWPHYARVALSHDISAEFPASSLKESIRAFLKWAYKNWRVPPRFVVLAADTDVIPMHFYNRGGVAYASDHYYQDIEGDLVPEITVSRLPTSNSAQLRQVCDYIARYPHFRGGDWGGWQNRVMLSAYQSNTYETTCDAINNTIKGRYTVIKRYAKNSSKSQVTDTLKQGVLFAVYRGHGSKTAWLSSNGLNSGDVQSLANQGRPPFVLNICCQNGWIDDNNTETIAESFVRHRKSVACFASSRDSWTYPNNDFIKYMFDAVMTGRCQTPAEIIRYAKLKMVRNHPTSNMHHDNTVMYNLFGDPTADVASNAEFLRGEWEMNHDGWQGVLKVTRIWNYHIVAEGAYRAPVWNISGEYLGNNKKYPFTGKLGGFDSNQLGTGSRRTDYRFEFNIQFSTNNKQRFVVYIHTWNNRLFSGLTWWAKHPFGVQARKR